MEQNDLGTRGAPAPAPAVDTGVWPPPPTGGPPVGAVIAPVFSPVRRLARAILVLLGLYAVSAMLGLGDALLPPPPAGRQVVIGLVALAQGLVLAGMGVCFLVWTYRLNRNLRVLGVAGVRYAPAWAVAYFFVPVLSLYRPYQVFREIWQASDPGPAARTDQAWQNLRSPALLGFWWASVVLSNVMDSLSARSARDAGIDIADNAVGLLSALLAFQVVRLVTARQEKAARLLFLLT